MTTDSPPDGSTPLRSGNPVDLARTIRALRRHADLSQRDLAERSGVPQATIARIESGRATDPRYGTVERLVLAMGGAIGITVEAPAASGCSKGDEGPGGTSAYPVPPVPHDELRDLGDRRYPAHLDVWPVREPKDWPGAWWADWYKLPPERYPLQLPPAAYERNRRYRDRRRENERIRRATKVRWVTGDGRPGNCWRFVAELLDGELVGELRAHERAPHLEYGDERASELVLDGVLVARRYRGLGIGGRLVDAMTARMAAVGIERAHAVAERQGVQFLAACGFRGASSRPLAMELLRPLSAERGQPW
ncbi:GNAT family N-acetyltransferase [Micromonospora sp. NPDC000089]|uniref:GNAT family N-acetyltransferase n=1 Tax=unclassified Micromonospora TaxID=2617518 RepID=UPI0036925309